MIVDLLYGQLKSRLRCKVCSEESNTFDPMLGLCLPIPRATSVNVRITFYPQNLLNGNQIREEIVEAKLNETLGEVINQLRSIVRSPDDEKYYLRKFDWYGDLTSEPVPKSTSVKDFFDCGLAVYAYKEMTA